MASKINPNFFPERINKGYEENHEKIEDAYLMLIKKNGKVPTLSLISAETGLSLNTISKHLKDIRLAEMTPKQKLRMERVLNTLANKAESGDIRAIELYLKVVADWIPKTEVTGEVDRNKILKIEFSNGKNVSIDKQLVVNNQDSTDSADNIDSTDSTDITEDNNENS